ncbi:MAG: hypothetical protein ABI557_15590 [Aureliella sp.]
MRVHRWGTLVAVVGGHRQELREVEIVPTYHVHRVQAQVQVQVQGRAALIARPSVTFRVPADQPLSPIFRPIVPRRDPMCLVGQPNQARQLGLAREDFILEGEVVPVLRFQTVGLVAVLQIAQQHFLGILAIARAAIAPA